MWKLQLICLVLIFAIMSTDATGNRRYRNGQDGSYAGAGGYAGAYGGGNGAYTGSYADDYGTGDFTGTGFDYAPGFGDFIDPYLFHEQLTAHILAQHAAQTNAIQSQFGNQAYYGNTPHRYAPSYAAASGSIGPGGYYQSAYISPEGSTPNVVNRFGGSSPGGYKGVSVSSFSTSSDVNGKRTGQRGAQTTVNDNGKITTYRVNS